MLGAYVEDMYEAWAHDPKSVHPSWDSYFRYLVDIFVITIINETDHFQNRRLPSSANSWNVDQTQ